MTSSDRSDMQPSPYSTGGGGTTLEHQYGAVLMSHLLSGNPIDILGDEYTPTKIHFQAPLAPVDDFIIEGERSDGSIRSVAIAVRRDPNLVESNEPSVKLMASFIAFLSDHTGDVTAGDWRMAIAASIDSIHAKQLKTLIEIGRDQPNNQAFRAAIGISGRTDGLVRNRLASLDKVVAKALKRTRPSHSAAEAEVMTWSILSSLHVHYLLLEGASTSDRTSAIAALRGIHPLRTAEAGTELFDRLSGLSSRYASSAAIKGSLQLQRDLGLRMLDGLWERQRVWTSNLQTSVASRRRVRRSIVGLSEAQINASFEWDPVFPPELGRTAAGEVVCLSGPIGSGKSDTAERWLLDVAAQFLLAETFSIPVWFRADEIVGSLELAVRTELAGAAPEVANELDVCIVIDGMDERSAGADALALEARAFVITHPRSRVMLTSREGVISSNVRVLPIPELTISDAEDLISRVSGTSPVHTHNWPESLRESIKRPLFAMLAGAQLGGNNLSTPTALIRIAAEHGAHGVLETESLRKLAVGLAWAGKAVDPLAVLPGVSSASLRGSRLIVFEGARCRFALPVFEQWFAAEAIQTGLVSLDEITADLVSFAKWRYALAAFLSSGTRESVDPIMNHIARWNPGAIGWLVKESLPASLGSGDGAHVDSWREEAKRIWTATKSFSEGLGTPAKRLVRPTRAVDASAQDPFDGLSLNIQTRSGLIAQNWRLKTSNRQQFTSEVVEFFPVDANSGSYITAKQGAPADAENWLWRWVFDDFSQDLSESLSRGEARYLMPSNGLVARERVAWTCREIHRGAPAARNSQAETVLRRIDSALQSISSEFGSEALDGTIFNFGGKAEFTAAELREVVFALESGSETGEDIWPGPDLSQGGWVWSGYSTKRMLERVTKVYEGAMEAYEEIRSTLFGSFDLTLGHAALFPGNIVGTLRYDADDLSLAGSPVLSYSVRPHSQAAGLETKGAANITYSAAPDPQLIFQELAIGLENHLAEHPEAGLFARASYSETALDIFHRRPATAIALDWLWSDLSQLGWTHGRKPDLR